MAGVRRLRLTSYAALGVVSVALAAGVAQVVSAAGQWFGWLGTPSSPVNSLGEWFITVTPQWLKKWAISEFGTDDKQALLVGMTLTVAVTAVLIGVLARPRMSAALVVSGVLSAGALVAVLTRADARWPDAIPTVLGAGLGLALLNGAGRIGRKPIGRPSVSTVPDPVGTMLPVHRRRQFLRLVTFGAVVAAASGVLSRLIPSASEVEASRARIAIPLPSDSQPIQGLTSVAPSTSRPSTRVRPTTRTPSSTTPAPSPSTASTAAPSSSTASSATASSATASSATASSATASSATASSATASSATASSATASSATASSPATTAATATTKGSTASVEFPGILGLSPFITPTGDFYRIDTALSPPLIRAEDWSLRIHGMVRQELEFNYFALMAEPQVERSITLTCVSNPVGGHLVGNATWIGVRLDRLLQRAGVLFGADCVLSTSIDGFTSTTPLTALTDGRDALLAVAMNGSPLPIEHGFPVRMIVPGLYGYVSATKWVVDLEVTTFARNSSYWTSRGYAELAPVKMSSRIDVPAPYTSFSAGDLVMIAGVAWAQHDGISAVQVQIDDGPWLRADTAGQLSIDTWRQWRYRWSATKGSHIIRCRAVDTAGVLQDATVRDVLPDGATGYASVVLMIT